MFQIDRHRNIYKYILKNKNATVNELAKIFDVTTMTIRRDLHRLELDGLITKVHGGAVVNDKSEINAENLYDSKRNNFSHQKIAIAKEAAKLIKDNQTIILDAGTTCMEIAKLLITKENLKVITTDVTIAAYLMDYKNIEVYCTGGLIQTSTGTCLDTHTIDFLNNIHADISFVGASSISEDLTLSTFIPIKAKIKKAIINAGTYKVLVTDSSKFNKKSFSKITNLSTFDIIIANADLNNNILNNLKNNNIHIKLAENGDNNETIHNSR